MDLVYILLTVLVIWGIAVITPGPNFFITAHTAVGDSRLSAFFIVLGITVGTMIWAICGYLGINILFKTAPWLFFLTLKLAGGCYLIYLGIRLLFSKNKNTKTVTTIKNSNIKNFRAGVLTNLSNPKNGGICYQSLCYCNAAKDSSCLRYHKYTPDVPYITVMV